jgi:hypothetical protein
MGRMIFCRYIGGEVSQIGEIEFDSIGQRATFSERGFRDIVLGGAAFLPVSMFDRLRFTDTELEKHGPIGARYFPPDTFCNKLLTAQQLFRELRDEFLAGKSIEDILATVGESDVELVP